MKSSFLQKYEILKFTDLYGHSILDDFHFVQGVNLVRERDYKSVLIVKCAALFREHKGYFM